MDYIKVPTDSMYKFLAVTGLVLIVASIFWGYGLFKAFFLTDLGISTKQVVIGGEFNHLISLSRLFEDEDKYWKRLEKYDVSFLDRPYEEWTYEQKIVFYNKCVELYYISVEMRQPPAISKIKEYLTKESTREEYKAKTGFTDAQYDQWVKEMEKDGFHKLTRERIEAAKEFGPQMIQLLTEEQQRRVLEATLFEYSFVAGGLLFVGFVLMVVGFTLWYRRGQKYEDALLRKKATEAAN